MERRVNADNVTRGALVSGVRLRLVESESRAAEHTEVFGPPPDRETRREVVRDQGQVITFEGHEVCLEGKAGWARPLVCKGWPDEVHVSADRLLLLTSTVEYHSWGYLGPALLVDRHSGEVVAELRGERCAALSDGRFLLGLEGYDRFDTWLCGAGGAVEQQWRSYGHYIVDSDERVRVIEQDRRWPTRSRIARLHMDGELEHGDALADAQASAPVLLNDKTALFVDGGLLCSAGYDLRKCVLQSLLPIAEDDRWRFHANVSLEGTVLTVMINERTAGVPLKYTMHQWRFELGR